MTKEELRAHCEKQVKMCEEWAKGNGREPSGKIYEEHKLILDLINELQDKSYELWKESYEEEHLRNIRLEEKIKALEQELTPIKNERPTKCGNYLVQVASTDGTATIDYFDVDHFNGDGTWTHYTVGDTKKVSKNIVAWMHLPKMVKVGEVNDKRRRT